MHGGYFFILLNSVVSFHLLHKVILATNKNYRLFACGTR